VFTLALVNRRPVALGALVGILAVAAGAGASTVSPALYSACVPVVGASPVTTSSSSLVFASADGSKLVSARADGSERRTIYSSAVPVGHPAVSRDGRLIAFDRGGEVWLMNSDGSDADFVAVGTDPSFSPDGSMLAIGGPQTSFNRYELDVIALDGTGRRAVAFDAAPFPHPSWSPDGTAIAFVSFTRVQLDFPSIKRVGADGTGEAGVRVYGSDPSWSPDGRWIAYTDDGDRSLPTEVHAVRPDGSGDRLVVRVGRSDAFSPAWSATSTSLLFVTAPAGGPRTGGSLWTATSGGLGAHPLAPSCRFGTAGPNRMHGSRRADRIYALEGGDLVDVRRGGRDVVHCGAGRDTVYADRSDKVARDCERVSRRLG
jgi:TolB protein